MKFQLKLVGLLVGGAMLLSGCRMSQQSYTDQQLDQTAQSAENTPRDREKVFITVGDDRLEVEVVTSTESITQGLSGRDEIGSDGMLFVFSSPRRSRFWMKEMKFDLDMIWVVQGEIIAISEDVPYPSADTALSELPTYGPDIPVEMVLEVPAGTAVEKKWQVGDQLIVPW